MIYAVLHHGQLAAYRTEQEARVNHGAGVEVLRLLEECDLPSQDVPQVVNVLPEAGAFWAAVEGKK